MRHVLPKLAELAEEPGLVSGGDGLCIGSEEESARSQYPTHFGEHRGVPVRRERIARRHEIVGQTDVEVCVRHHRHVGEVRTHELDPLVAQLGKLTTGLVEIGSADRDDARSAASK